MKNLILFTTLLAFTVVVLGAYVRLSNAGLGCPDWPGCYGQIIPPQALGDALDPGARSQDIGKAWKEMIHRYAAGFLGGCILLIFLLAWGRKNAYGSLRRLSLITMLLLCMQVVLGMWTVTLLLKPIIVLAHLLGGMAILAMLYCLLLNQLSGDHGLAPVPSSLFTWSIAGLVVLIIQITLGGWTSSNYAALICPDFPRCQGQWWPTMDFYSGFSLWPASGVNYEGGVLHSDARTAIHVSHRLGALLTVIMLATIAVRLLLQSHKLLRCLGGVMMGLLILQIALGIANILLHLPLPIAVAHNGTAGLLLLTMLTLVYHGGLFRQQNSLGH